VDVLGLTKERLLRGDRKSSLRRKGRKTREDVKLSKNTPPILLVAGQAPTKKKVGEGKRNQGGGKKSFSLD